MPRGLLRDCRCVPCGESYVFPSAFVHFSLSRFCGGVAQRSAVDEGLAEGLAVGHFVVCLP